MASMLMCFLIFFGATLAAGFSDTQPKPVPGLSYTFYKSTCPELEWIIRTYLKKEFKKDIGLAAGLLRLHFHDCFVQGCDASVLLDGSASGPSEQDAPPNLTLRPAAFKAINDLRALIDKMCGVVVSCADVVAVAARDSVALTGGPHYKVPLGRRDGLTFATVNVTLADLPPPTSNVSFLINTLNKINLTVADLVTLSGGHTIGLAHCTSFTNRLYPTQDTNMDKTFAKNLKLTCPAANTTNSTVNDIRTPNTFDNKYYVNLVNKEGLFTSDQGLFSDFRTKALVALFASNKILFFEHFALSMVKMGQISVLTGSQGEIRTNCSARNSGSGLWSVVEDLLEQLLEFPCRPQSCTHWIPIHQVKSSSSSNLEHALHLSRFG
ncbi:peroxidase 12-like [Dioscorea cayenensis subsp. rotundata]|uniref:Peroxidase n=1 Tax=Dioscorea cayennensis subsp. rotundata TaxID=55577 RepID=A0AB40BDZ6_DIOCR|nr:peroxidase 12-like [Dioscorea cayenensis subsp. rotundata]